MTDKALSNLFAFFCGDAFATTIAAHFTEQLDWLQSLEVIALKGSLIILSGLIGGAAGVVGKELMQRFVIDKYFKVLVFAFAIGSLTSCAPKVISGVVTTQATDSTSIKVDTAYKLFQVNADTIIYYAEVDCPGGSKPTNFSQKVDGKRSTANIALQNGQLKVDLNVKALTDSIAVLNTKINNYKTSVTVDKQTVSVPFIPKFYKVCASIIGVEIALLVIALIALGIRIYLKSQIPI